MENRIKEVLDERGLKVPDLARLMDYDYVTVYRWCKGIHQPSLENLLRVSKVLKVSIKKLIK